MGNEHLKRWTGVYAKGYEEINGVRHYIFGLVFPDWEIGIKAFQEMAEWNDLSLEIVFDAENKNYKVYVFDNTSHLAYRPKTLFSIPSYVDDFVNLVPTNSNLLLRIYSRDQNRFVSQSSLPVFLLQGYSLVDTDQFQSKVDLN
ncbi:MAG: hypothetical protein KBF32_01630 [Chitinophagales bacterium]|nr:hypothetical protein [Chitinophagales bacterium]